MALYHVKLCHLTEQFKGYTHLDQWGPNKVLKIQGQTAVTDPIPDFFAVLCTPPAPGLPGEPVFLLKRLLKKLAKTPSLAALSKQKPNINMTE